jgi:PAS domain S-box-containing protein
LEETLDETPGKTLILDDTFLRQVLDSIYDGVVVVDRAGTIVYANPAYTRIMHVPLEEALGRNMQEITPNARTLTVLRDGEATLHETHYSERLGFDVVLSATPMYREGTLVGAVTVFRGSQELMELYATYRRAHGLVDYYTALLVKEQGEFGSFDSIIGHSRSLAPVIKMAHRVAETDATVLITGENGVGKDVFAQAIQQASKRRDRPFIAVNCAAIPDALLESELFGFDPGSFTGAAKGGKLGKFELANGGTIFLDEIGDMSSSMQAKLLRVLQQKEIEKIGSTRVIRVDVRIIAATNRNLEQMVREGRFREDLLYRLNVITIALPPLRERKADIPRLARHFLEHFCGVYKKKVIFAPEAFESLERYNWPGNVRQLRNTIERAVILCDGDVVLPEYFGADFNSPTSSELPDKKGLRREVQKTELRVYEEALLSCNNNKSLAMKKIGVSRRTFYKRLREFGLL